MSLIDEARAIVEEERKKGKSPARGICQSDGDCLSPATMCLVWDHPMQSIVLCDRCCANTVAMCAVDAKVRGDEQPLVFKLVAN